MSSSSSSTSGISLDFSKFNDLPDPPSVDLRRYNHINGLVSRTWSDAAAAAIKKADVLRVFSVDVLVNEESFGYYDTWKNTMNRLFEHKARGWMVTTFKEGPVLSGGDYDDEHNYRYWTVSFVHNNKPKSSPAKLASWTVFIASLKPDEIPQPQSGLTEAQLLEDNPVETEEQKEQHREWCARIENCARKMVASMDNIYTQSVCDELVADNPWIEEMVIYYHESGMSTDAYNEYLNDQSDHSCHDD